MKWMWPCVASTTWHWSRSGKIVRAHRVGFEAEQVRLKALLEAAQTQMSDIVMGLEAPVNTTVEKGALVCDRKLESVATTLISQEAKFKMIEGEFEKLAL